MGGRRRPRVSKSRSSIAVASTMQVFGACRGRARRVANVETVLLPHARDGPRVQSMTRNLRAQSAGAGGKLVTESRAADGAN